MSGDRARLLLLFAAILLVLILIAFAGGCGDREQPVPLTVPPPPIPVTLATTPTTTSIPPDPPLTEAPPVELRAVVSSVETVVVLGDAARDAPGVEEPPNSTLLETTVVTSIVPDPALCHADHPNAVAVSNAIRNNFPSSAWATMCRIAWCESNFVPGARNPSGATGIFQIMPFWFKAVPDADPWSISGSARLARHVYNQQGFPAWSCY